MLKTIATNGFALAHHMLTSSNPTTNFSLATFTKPHYAKSAVPDITGQRIRDGAPCHACFSTAAAAPAGALRSVCIKPSAIPKHASAPPWCAAPSGTGT